MTATKLPTPRTQLNRGQYWNGVAARRLVRAIEASLDEWGRHLREHWPWGEGYDAGCSYCARRS